MWWFKVGGLWFLRIGSYQFSFCRSTKIPSYLMPDQLEDLEWQSNRWR